MKKINRKQVESICGGNPAVLYPIVGCGMITAMDYMDKDEMSYEDMGYSCARGAIHGANIGIGITAPIGNQYVRYAAGMAYSRYAPALVNNFVENSRTVALRRKNNATFLGGFND